jgi:Na+/H+-dicarboxylate symporter
MNESGTAVPVDPRHSWTSGVRKAPSSPTEPPKRRTSTTYWIFGGVILGVLLGGFFPQDTHPHVYNFFQFLSKGFITLIQGLIVPLLFSTIVVGIAQTGDVKAVGRMGAKALIYFELVTTCALFIGLFVANVIKPGEHLSLDLGAQPAVAAAADRPQGGWDIVLHMFPANVVREAADGQILPLVVFASLFGIALTRIGDKGIPVLTFFRGIADTMFKYTDLIMSLTPIGVFGSMAFNVSRMAAGYRSGDVVLKGWSAVLALLGQYAVLVGSLYLALALLIVLVLVPIMVAFRVRIRAFVRALREPVITAFSTASSEAALPRLLENVVRFGVPRRVAAFVIPVGYSFNLDGSTLYLVLASLTIAQAAHIPMSVGEQLAMLVTFVLTSKGVAAMPRATLVIIAATCQNFRLPGAAGVAMLLAVDGVMDMARTSVNVIGNGLASVIVSRLEGVFGTESEEEASGGESTKSEIVPILESAA